MQRRVGGTALGQRAVGDHLPHVAGALLLHVVDDHVLHELRRAAADVAARAGGHRHHDLPVGAACAPVVADGLRFGAQC